MPTRRTVLTTGFGALGAAALGMSLNRLAFAGVTEDRYFVFAYFPGAWDTLMSMDPKATDTGLERIDRSLDRESEVDVGDLVSTYGPGSAFEPMAFAGGTLTSCMRPLVEQFAAGGTYAAVPDVGMCVVRGMSMDTLTHQVGRRRFITGQPPSGQNARGSAMATVLSALLSRAEPIPNLNTGSESYNVDQPQWATALSVDSVDDLLKALRPGSLHVAPEERERIEAMITEFRDCIVSRRSPSDQVALDSRLAASGLVGAGLDASFDLFANTPEMQLVRDRFRIPNGQASSVEARAAMAAQAIVTGTSRVTSYLASPNLDTHFDNWADDQFNGQFVGYRGLAAIVDHLAASSHPDGGTYLDRTTILAFSDFSRTPVFNGNGGRDHWLVNSALLLGKGIQTGIVGQSSNEGMAPTTQVIDGVETYVKPEHLHAALLHDVNLPLDSTDLRVQPFMPVLTP